MATGKMTTTSLRKETKDMLRELGGRGETYDAVIRRLIKGATIRKLDERWNRILREEKFIPMEEP